MTTDPSFEIPARPQRRYPYSGGVEYEGETVFRLRPTTDWSESGLQALVEEILGGGAYTYGDWLDLPMPLYLVHDEQTGDVFRVAVRGGTVELYVLPATESAGLRQFYETLDAHSDDRWTVELTVERA
ncbi:hypothetical protein [Halapricum hydrolyticum]|uniref:Uncharacterized protein n=1 Tax=Halapricum hydrolyticum TaxID=2979991 RepID=A0AAE3IBL0_9EURY|nr:hypothetical protein [Halapricum hydrolyticum]MCU4717306.1 hypothetical protein [Halapricum hydrolyticum]MCU4726233.1 hypothetical protein [Halapricum hydrolyticum]